MRRVRFLIIEALYESETSDHSAEAVFNRRLSEVADEDPEVGAPGPSGYGRGMLRAVLRRKEELDRYIHESATQYPVETLAVVDRNILRLAICELLSTGSAPAGAVVNEAVELAHRYGGDSSPAFINGVLRTLSIRIRPEASAEKPLEAVDSQNPKQQET